MDFLHGKANISVVLGRITKQGFSVVFLFGFVFGFLVLVMSSNGLFSKSILG